MPYVDLPDGTRFGVGLDEIIEAITNLFTRSTPHLSYDFGFIRGIYAKEHGWLKLDTVQGVITAPYTLVFDYRDHDAGSSWGRVTIVDPYQFPPELEAHKDLMIVKFKAAGKIEERKGNRLCPRMLSVDVEADGTPAFRVHKAEYFHQIGSNLTADEPLQPPLNCRTLFELGISIRPTVIRNFQSCRLQG
jgi:hypothetical protein